MLQNWSSPLTLPSPLGTRPLREAPAGLGAMGPWASGPRLVMVGWLMLLQCRPPLEHAATLTALAASRSAVGPPVATQAGAPSEGLPAFVTLVGFQSAVDPPVLDQVGGPPEGLAAVATAVGPLPGVDALVLQEAGALPEGLAALATLVGLLARVDPAVLGELRAPPEELAAVGTPIGLGPTVDALVFGQAVDTPKGLAAVVTVEGQVAGVHALVLEELLAIQELPAACLAGERLFGSVELLMAKEVGAHLEGPPTLLAVKRLLSAVDAQVLTEARVLLESLPTFLTLEGLRLPLHLLPFLHGIFRRSAGPWLGLCSHVALPVLVELRDAPEDPPAIATLPALLLAVNSLVLHKEDLEPKGIPTLLTCKVMFYGQVLGAPPTPLQVSALFDLRAGCTGHRGAGGRHLLGLSVFTHSLLLCHQDAFGDGHRKTLYSQSVFRDGSDASTTWPCTR